ncbi:hypothetical protein [Paenibacillus silvae]|uniref:hypothetical protein n=1 Tax=Paenibacillus silvae TaxID=1325358 RepID=UPI0025A2C058|nr:hypothetical protein [Paenibacillus silvae]
MNPLHRWLNKLEVASSGIPVFVPRQIQDEVSGEWVWDGRWNMERPIGDILLGIKRCGELGAPVADDEPPAGYIYAAKTKDQFRYMPLFSRAFEQLAEDKLTELERTAIKLRQTYAGYGMRARIDRAVESLVTQGYTLDRLKLVISPFDRLAADKDVRTSFGMLTVAPDMMVPEGVSYVIQDVGKDRALAWVKKRNEWRQEHGSSDSKIKG